MGRSENFLPLLAPLLEALGEELALLKAESQDLVVVGGAALNLLEVVDRPTVDVDVVAFWPHGEGVLVLARPFPPELLQARASVAKLFHLDEDWLNPGPTDLLRWGLPQGCEERFHSLHFGPALNIHVMAPQDLICLKLFAYADTRSGRHRRDLLALTPSLDDWRRASEWCQSQDDSEGFKWLLEEGLSKLGVKLDA